MSLLHRKQHSLDAKAHFSSTASTHFLRTLPVILLISFFCLAASGCAPGSPRLSGILGRSTGILASLKVLDFDKPAQPVRPATFNSGRDYGFTVGTVQDGDGWCLKARNRRNAPVSVNIRLTLEENIASDRDFPLDVVVPPNSELCAARIFALQKGKDFRFNSLESWLVGDYKARHRPPGGYRVPWQKGQAFLVTQAPEGRITTHTDISSRNAIDFSMPEGTPVLAARGGVVIDVADSFSEGAYDRALLDKANYVDVLHEDGTIATYAHLARQSVSVQVGQQVAVGDQLGLSGSTGYSSGPHLHFFVWTLEQAEKGFERVSLPIEFSFDDGKPGIYLKQGMVVSAAGVMRDAPLVADGR